MGRGYALTCFAISLSCALFSGNARATTYPWTNIARQDIQVVPNVKVEHEVRLEMVRSATATIDVAIYDQRYDTAIALPLLKALREAADRGVKIRYYTSWIGQYFVDINQNAARYLTEPPCKTPIQYLIYGGPELQARGWNISDGVHEKLFIVDGRRVMITGRGHADFYLNWVDTAHLIKGPLVPQLVNAFEWIWYTLRRERALFQPKPTWFSKGRTKVPSFEPDLAAVKLDPAETAESDRLKRWLRAPAGRKELRLIPARVLHHDFIRQLQALRKRPGSYSYEERVKLLKDPVVESVLAKLPTARDIRFNTLSVVIHPKIKAGLIQALGRGAKVRIFTNGAEATKVVAPIPLPWSVSLPDMDDLLAAGAEIQTFEPNSRNRNIYLHRKLIVIDDTTYFGSHNLNLPSTVANDELSIEVFEPGFADSMRALDDEAIASNGARLDRITVHQERITTPIAQWFARPLLGFF